VGKAAALALLNAGYTVAFVGRRRDVLDAAIAESSLNSNASAISADISRPEEIRRVFATVRESYGRLDLLFNNAGIVAPAVPFEDLPLGEWQAVVDLNLTASFLCAQEAVRMMKAQKPQGGRIVNNGSISAHTPRPLSAAYTTTKHAITGLTKSISLDNREFDICCSQIDIGNAATQMTARMPEGVIQPNGSIVQEATMAAESVGKAVAYIASLPRDTNVLFMTVMANRMPFVGRG
jgi:NAD(P)-dependent dehydrogenase (short-subunit alcohol dehydrogenase family)